VDAFLDSFTHEMRTPLTSICACSQILTHQEEIPLPKELKELLEMIDRDSQRISRLVDNVSLLMDLERGRSIFKFERVSVNEAIIDEVNTFGEYGLRKDVRFDLHLPKSPIFIRADPLKLGNLINHLLDNAMVHGNHGEPAEVRLSRSDGNAQITVKNRSEPVPCKNAEEPFQKYWQAHRGDLTRKPPGLGIGLTICKLIAKAHRGSIVYEPKGKTNQVFRVRLPATK
jgi:K+-sensing histidine kinase KdpD